MRSLSFASMVLLWAFLSSSSTFAQSCPALMRTASRLILVTVPTLTSSAGKLRLFERRQSDAGWSVVGAAEPVTCTKLLEYLSTDRGAPCAFILPSFGRQCVPRQSCAVLR